MMSSRRVAATSLLATALFLGACGQGPTSAGAFAEPDAEALRIAEQQALSGLLEANGPHVFVCNGDEHDLMEASFYQTDPSTLVAERGAAQLVLFQVRSASGAHYVRDDTSFWEHQGEVALEWLGQPQVICVPQALAFELGSSEWVDTVETHLRVLDSEGHGPDPGSMEWMSAVSQRLGLDQQELPPGTEAWYRAVDALVMAAPVQ
ncbi:MAG TPA: MliC family protein [Hyphomicrobiales bacterium]|nr:MliC family protein [Hyphomicrobiales bacterium]